MAKNKKKQVSRRVESEHDSDEANYVDSPRSQTQSPTQTPQVRQRQRSDKTKQYDDERADAARKAAQPRKEKATDLSTEEMLAIIAERQNAAQRGEELTISEIRERRQSQRGHSEGASTVVSPPRRQQDAIQRPAGVAQRNSVTLRLNNTPKRRTAEAENQDIAAAYNAQQASKQGTRTKAITPTRVGTAKPASPRNTRYSPGGRLHSMVLNLPPVPTCEGSIQLSFQYLGGY
ncbi:hypothetical protein SISSUDRAFT_1067480 [Sistotremastrum suecicum HHB10207 ss-3]|uniref:Uncharacterized protein n=1 Tax=Sistotremastrum suecicum HHB10207 ss-3 TaxID=1314776 RepID=A0A165X2G6_9AGAM|nr:hypothetical protein SISSUDRAFT_1067480 [Sistotremastrum suecicum HHB10207 ss-3]